VRRIEALFPLALAATACSGHHTKTLGGYGVSLQLPKGWYGLSGPGQLQAADFPLARSVLSSAERARVPRGHVHVVVWDYGPAVSYLPRSRPPAKPPVAFRRRDLTRSPLEGFPFGNAFAIRNVNFDGELLEVLADFGPKPLNLQALSNANRVVRTLGRPNFSRAQLRPVGGGVSLRLLPGWGGRIVVPAATFAARQVFRAHHAGTRIALLELPPSYPMKQVRLPVAPVKRSRTFAHSVFMANGHSIDLSVAFRSPSALAEANRLIATLRVAPRPWTFSECFSLRVPGTWTVGVRRKGGCYQIVTLRGRGLRVVIEELRPKERATGRVILRAGRRFQVQTTPASAEHEAETVLATLRAKPRSALRR
jgi:hypothetical protein